MSGLTRTIDALRHDLRFAFRQLRRNPGFTAVAVVTLALGIGANTTVFSMVNAVLLRPFPFHEPERLVAVESTHPSRPGQGLALSYPDYLDIRQEVEALEQVALWDWHPFNLRASGNAVFAGGARVTATFFETLGADPLVGRIFAPEEDRVGGSDVVLLSEGLWEDEFGRDPQVVGRSVVLDGARHVVIGVMPNEVGFPERVRLWVPLQVDATRSPRGNRWLAGIGRLASGGSMASARAELRALATRLEEAYPETNGDRGLRVVELREELLGEELTPLFLLLFGAVGVLLLIVCANLASLLLARGAGRERELAVRSAMGASRWRIAGQLLTESAVLAAGGAVLGWALGRWGIILVIRAVPTEIPAWIRLEPDLRVLGFVAAASVLAVLLFGLAPALLSARKDVESALRDSSARTGASRGRSRLRSGLVVGEVALSLTLLVGAGLVLRSLLSLASVDPGFATEDRLMGTTSLAAAVYPDDSSRIAFYRRLQAELEALPVVRSSGLVSRFPLRGSSNANNFTVEGQTDEEYEENPFVLVNSVDPGYFRTMGIPLLRGRGVRPTDDGDSPPVVVVNRKLARHYWPDADPVGQRLNFGRPDDPGQWRRVVGVVGNVHHHGLDRPPRIQLYLPYLQSPTSRMSVVVEGGSDRAALAGSLRSALRSADPNQAAYDVMSLDAVVAEASWEWRFFSGLFWLFGGLAAFLACVGLYGVLSYLVARRGREIGVRLAMGAAPVDVIRMVVGDGGRLFALGAALGLAGGVLLNRTMTSFLYQVKPVELPTYAGVLVLLALVAALATYLPARRAAAVDPATVLREE